MTKKINHELNVKNTLDFFIVRVINKKTRKRE